MSAVPLAAERAKGFQGGGAPLVTRYGAAPRNFFSSFLMKYVVEWTKIWAEKGNYTSSTSVSRDKFGCLILGSFSPWFCNTVERFYVLYLFILGVWEGDRMLGFDMLLSPVSQISKSPVKKLSLQVYCNLYLLSNILGDFWRLGFFP